MQHISFAQALITPYPENLRFTTQFSTTEQRRNTRANKLVAPFVYVRTLPETSVVVWLCG